MTNTGWLLRRPPGIVLFSCEFTKKFLFYPLDFSCKCGYNMFSTQRYRVLNKEKFNLGGKFYENQTSR